MELTMRQCSKCERPAAQMRTVCYFHKKNPDRNDPRAYVRGLASRFNYYAPKSTTGCREWEGMTYRNGYGKITHAGRPRLAHRVSYEFFVGPIPSGMELDHLCMNRRCVEPTHLEPVTPEENKRRQVNPRGRNGQFIPKAA